MVLVFQNYDFIPICLTSEKQILLRFKVEKEQNINYMTNI